MAELKTKANTASVREFLNAVDDKQRRAECKTVARMMREATGNIARMWGTNIVGYGSYDYKYASGREGTWFECGFSPRANSLTVYIISGFSPFASLMKKLGEHKTGKSCLYIKNLDDIDQDVMRELIDKSVEYMRDKYKA